MKVLIYNTMTLKNVGGPSGYLYNLKEYLNNKEEFHFLKNEKLEEKIKINKYLIKIKKKLKSYSFISRNLLLKNIKKNETLKSNQTYDIIHFHSTLSFYQTRKNNLDALKVLMSHSPQPFYEELLEEYNLDKNKLKKSKLDQIKEMDYYSFASADYLIFPCIEAMEPYITRDNQIRKILEKRLNEKKVKFLPTGIVDKNIEFQRDYFYKK